MNNVEIATLLNGLVEISRDGAEGFKACADNASDQDLKMYFQDRAQSCEEAINTLSVEVIYYGGNPDTSGTTTGTLHRTWINIKTALTKKDNLAVLEECEMGEAAAVMAYENALRQEIPDNLRALLERLYEGVKRNHERVRQLRDEARNNPNLA
ncbi:PA2169 family four-helix-bundle protein [Nitrosomonas sp. Nm166]|uniref:ferritin-like domain-containing protein n=1 Tax=Nitrosomonas sp. Nm166 TaxID=1881054 RepID=UPI0008E4DDBF|nr:PA2169 family four-helix-bundle protein [Nitrosomonas sp. Nm166]SFE12916.1 conserved hypothetical protein [Nitrosomonas sp. Nm166]